MKIRGWPAVLILLGIFPAMLLARDALEQQRIDYLIESVGSLSGASFIRNGQAHSAAAARDHLRVKLKAAGSRVKTAEDFIRYCASESSVSQQPYQIRFADGKVIPAAAFFRARLGEFDRARQ